MCSESSSESSSESTSTSSSSSSIGTDINKSLSPAMKCENVVLPAQKINDEIFGYNVFETYKCC